MNKNWMMKTTALLVVLFMMAGCNKSEKVETPTDTGAVVQPETTVETTYVDPYVVEDDSEELPDDTVETTVERAEETIAATESTVETEANTEPTTETEETTSTQPTENENVTPETTSPSGGGNNGICCKYVEYQRMSPADQQAYMETFASPADFIVWIQQAEAAHNTHDGSIIVEGGDVNIGDYTK